MFKVYLYVYVSVKRSDIVREGKRESRYAHLFSGDFDYAQSVEQKVDSKVRIEALEYEVSVLKSEIERLNGELDRR